MISEEDLAKEGEIWSVESRLVDSLGTISRDLGRELSLSEFLTVLAPEVRGMPYSPMLPDAHVFSKILRRSHRADIVRFSRKNQESAVRWIPRLERDPMWSIDFRDLLGEASFMEFVAEIRSGRVRAFVDKINVEVCGVEGDGQVVDCVVTRVAPTIRAGSDLERHYSAIHEGIHRAIRDNLPLKTLLQLGNFAAALVDAVNGDLGQRRLKAAPEPAYWRENYHEVSEALQGLGIKEVLPQDLVAYSETLRRFNACSYWVDWWRREES